MLLLLLLLAARCLPLMTNGSLTPSRAYARERWRQNIQIFAKDTDRTAPAPRRPRRSGAATAHHDDTHDSAHSDDHDTGDEIPLHTRGPARRRPTAPSTAPAARAASACPTFMLPLLLRAATPPDHDELIIRTTRPSAE